MKLFRKFTASFLALVMVLSVCLSAVPAVADVPSKSIGNDYLSFSINQKTGFFNIQTLEGHPQKAADNNMNLLYAGDSIETSFTTVRVDGKDYIFGQDYGIFNLTAKPGETTVDAVNNTITTEWTVDGIKVIQKAYLSRTDNTLHSGNIGLEYSVENTTDKPHSVGIRVMFDNALGANDAPTPMVESEIAPIAKESQFFEGGRDPGDYIRYVDNFELPTKEEFFMFDNLVSDEPDKMIVGHWYNLASSKWTYSPDQDMAFTGGFNNYETVDTATALYWNEEELPSKAVFRKSLLYGVGDFSMGGKKSNFDVTIELDDSGLVLDETGHYVDDTVDVKVTVYNNVDGSEDLNSPKLDLMCESGAFFLYEKEGSDLTGFENITELIGRIEKGTIATFNYELVVEEPEMYKTIDVVATLTGNTEDSKTSVRKYVFARAPQKTGKDFMISQISRSKYHKSGNRTMLLKGTYNTGLLEDRTKWSLAFVNESDPTLRYEVPSENISLSSDTEMSVVYGKDMVIGKYNLEFAFFDEFTEVFGDTYTYKSIEIVDDSRLIMNRVSYVAVYRENHGQKSNYKVESFASLQDITKKSGELAPKMGEVLLIFSSDEGAMFDVEYDSSGEITGFVAAGDVTINDVAVAEKGTRIARFSKGPNSTGVRVSGKGSLYSAGKKDTLFDCDWFVECTDQFFYSLNDKSLKLEADGFSGVCLNIAMGFVNLQAGVFGKNAKGYTIGYSGTVNLLGYTPVAKSNKEKYEANKFERVGMGVNLSAAIDNVLFDKNGFVGIDTTFKASFVSTNIIGCAQMDVFAAEVGVDTIAGKYDAKFTVNIKRKLTVSAGAGLKEVTIDDTTMVLPSSFNVNFAVGPASAAPLIPGVLGLYMLGIDVKDMLDLVDDYSQGNTPEEYRLMVNQATSEISISVGFVLFSVFLLNGVGTFGTNHARFVLNGSLLELPGLTATFVFNLGWKLAVHDYNGNLLTPQQFSLLISGETNVFGIFKGTTSFAFSQMDLEGETGDIFQFVFKVYGALHVPYAIPVIGGVSLFGAGGTMSDTGFDITATIVGNDIGFSCDWDGNTNWEIFSEGGEKQPELAPNNMRVLTVKKPEITLMSSEENYVAGTISSVPGHTSLICVNYFGETPSYESLRLMIDGTETALVPGSNDRPDGNVYIVPDSGEGGKILIGIPEMAEGEHTYTLTADSKIRMSEMEAAAFAKMATATEVKALGNGTASVKSDVSLKGSTVELYYVKDKETYNNIKVEEYTDSNGESKVRVYKEIDGKKVEFNEEFYKKLSEHLLVSQTVEEDVNEVVLTPETRYDVPSGDYYLMALVRSPYGKISRCITENTIAYENVHQPDAPDSVRLVNAGNGALNISFDDAENADYDGYFVNLYNVTDKKYVIENQYFNKDDDITIDPPYVESGKIYRAEATGVNVVSADAFSESAEAVKSAEITVRIPEIIPVELKLMGEHPQGDYTDLEGNTSKLPYITDGKASFKAITPKNVKGRFVTDNTPGEWSKDFKSEFELSLSDLSAGAHSVYFEAKNEHGDISPSVPVSFAVSAGAPTVALDSSAAEIKDGKITISGKTNSTQKLVFMGKEYPVSADGRFEIELPVETNRYVEQCNLSAIGFDGQETTISLLAVNPGVKPIDSVVLRADGKTEEQITLSVGDTVKFDALGSAEGELRDMGDEISVIVHEGNSVAQLDSENTLTAIAPGTAFVKASWSLGSRIDGEKATDYVFEDMVKVTVLKKSEPAVPSIPNGATITTDDKLELEGDGEIYYTLDGSEPSKDSIRYTGPIKLPKGNVTVKVIVIKDGYGKSDVTAFNYKVKKESTGSTSVSGPAMVISGGNSSDASLNPGLHYVNYGYPLKITASEGTIYYTTDGTTPNKNSTEYKEPVRITKDMTVRAVVWTEGDVYGDVLTYDMKLNGYDIYLCKDLEKGSLLKGYEDNTFRPDRAITRAETAAILRRASEMYGYHIDENRFSDIDMWAKEEISELASADIINGYEDGTFKPDNAVTRAEFVTMLMRIIDNYGKVAPFEDTVDHWAGRYIAKAYEYGYINGYEDGTFRPDNTITRAEAVAIMSRVFGFDSNGTKTSFTDVTSDHWAFGYIAQ